MKHRGFEPRTTWLKVKCSTDWANAPFIYLSSRTMPRAGIEPATRGFSVLCSTDWAIWAKLRGQDLNLRPSGYEPDELPDCSTPRYYIIELTLKPMIGLEPITCWLQISCSANWATSAQRLSANGWRWIRTTEATCNRFTVCPLWPLGNPPIWSLFNHCLRSEADDRTRTDNLLITNQLLCQLSHIGIWNQ